MAKAVDLISFVRSLPTGPCYTPIYAKGVQFGKHDSVSQGKAPHEQSFYRSFSPADVAHYLETQPERFKAVGLFTGIRSDGLVILDVDANLASLKAKWGDTLNGAPMIVSTKRNAAKYVFRVPEDQRALVKGITGRATGKGYEVLWGMQGVIAGAYPGSSDGSAPAGQYRLAAGSFDSIPDAPEWLLAEMRAKRTEDAPAQGLIKNRKGLDFSGRTQDELAEIVHDCLSVLPHLGRGSEDYWWQVGAMVAETLPNDLGLTLWAAWSAQDPAFEDEWLSGNPCEKRWPHLVAKAGRPGNLGLGSLIKEADRYDAKRERFQDSSRRTIEEVEATQVQQIRNTVLDFAEVVRRARELMQLDNPAEMNYKLHGLAVEAGYRDKEALERLLVDQMQYEAQSDTFSLSELLSKDVTREFVIPDLLYKPGVVLLYGAGGDGKSMTAWTLAKHVAMGIPFIIKGKPVPVEQGPVLLLNGDQSLVQLQEQMEEVEMPTYAPITIRTDWSLQYYARFVRLVEQIKPTLIVVDSLIGCSGGKAFDENKSDFATPLYWLTRNNGVLFPATTIVVIHHANKQGGFRGSSAINDAVDEVWQLRKPTDQEVERVGRNARLVVVGKSRAGRSGSCLILEQQSDLTFRLSDYAVEELSTDAPGGVVDRVLARLRVCYPATRTRAELCADPLCGGSVAAIRKALQRLAKRGLVRVARTSPRSRGGCPENHYEAVLQVSPRGDIVCSSPNEEKPSAGVGSATGQTLGQEGVCPTAQPEFSTDSTEFSTDKAQPVENLSQEAVFTGTHPQETAECPSAKPSRTKGSASLGRFTAGIRAREASEDQALARLSEDAADESAAGTSALDAALDSWD